MSQEWPHPLPTPPWCDNRQFTSRATRRPHKVRVHERLSYCNTASPIPLSPQGPSILFILSIYNYNIYVDMGCESLCTLTVMYSTHVACDTTEHEYRSHCCVTMAYITKHYIYIAQCTTDRPCHTIPLTVDSWDRIQNNFPILHNIHTEAKLTT